MTPTQEAAMRQAMDALLRSRPEPRPGDDDYLERGWMEHHAAKEALRAALAEPVAVSERERWTLLLRAAGRVLQAFDDGYLQPDTETLQGSTAVDELRDAWEAFVPAVYRRIT